MTNRKLGANWGSRKFGSELGHPRHVRAFGTDSRNGHFDDATRREVWRRQFKNAISGFDICGARVYWDHYGKGGIYGWEIDHILPVSKGGKDNLDNLQVLHWKNNRSKGDSVTVWFCRMGRNGLGFCG